MEKVVYEGQEYSKAALSKILGVSPTTIGKYSKEAEANGEELEKVIKRNLKTYQYDGKIYRSIVKLSNAAGINRQTLTKLIELNLDKTIDEIVLEYKNEQKKYTYKGKTYNTKEEVAEDLGLNIKTVYKYLKLAEDDLEKAMELYENEHTYTIINGVRYSTQEELADFLNISVQTLNKYIENEGSIQVAVEKIQNREIKEYLWKGKTYNSLASVARDMQISETTLKRILENETNGDLDEAYNLYQKRNSGKYKGYTVNGKKYSSIEFVLKEFDISNRQYYNRRKEFDNNIESIINAILRERKEKQSVENEKKEREEEKREYIYKGEKIYTIAELSEKSGISENILGKLLKGYKRGNVDNIIQSYINDKKVYTYDNKNFDSIKSLAEYTGINELRLGRYIRKYNRNAEKAIFMIKIMDSKRKKIENLKENSETSENAKKTFTRSKKIMYDETTSLSKYCIENKINYSCIYYAISSLGRTAQEALENYNKNGQQIPTNWIYEKYNILLKHLLLNEKIDSKEIVSEMKSKVISLEEALENYIIKDEARKSNNILEWQMELYPILTSEYISEEEKLEFKKEFFVSDREMESLNKSKERVTKMKRKILLYEIAECVRDNIYPENEMIDVLKEYEITEEEIDTIFLDLYSNFYGGVRIAKGEKLFKEREILNDYIRNYDNMSEEERTELQHKRPQDIEYIKKVSYQIAFYKNAIKVESLTGQDIGKIGYTADIEQCENAHKILNSIMEDRKMEGVNIGDS